MEVNLVALSKPSATTDCDTAEEIIAYCARVSAPDNQGNKQTAQGLVKYLVNNDHWSPLEMVNMTVEIKTTRDIARQILRHRSFAFQEFSQRYAVVDVNKFVLREARLQDKKNRQNSIVTDNQKLQEEWHMKQMEVINKAIEVYHWALENGIAKEQARVVLPEGNTPSVMYMQGSIRSWLHYCLLRRGNGTQKEHIEVADQVWEVLKQHFPHICSIFEEIKE